MQVVPAKEAKLLDSDQGAGKLVGQGEVLLPMGADVDMHHKAMGVVISPARLERLSGQGSSGWIQFGIHRDNFEYGVPCCATMWGISRTNQVSDGLDHLRALPRVQVHQHLPRAWSHHGGPNMASCGTIDWSSACPPHREDHVAEGEERHLEGEAPTIWYALPAMCDQDEEYTISSASLMPGKRNPRYFVLDGRHQHLGHILEGWMKRLQATPTQGCHRRCWHVDLEILEAAPFARMAGKGSQQWLLPLSHQAQLWTMLWFQLKLNRPE